MKHEIAAGHGILGIVEYIDEPRLVPTWLHSGPPKQNDPCGIMPSSLCFSVGWWNLHLHDNLNDSRQWLDDEKVIKLGSHGGPASFLFLGLGEWELGPSDQPTTGHREHRRSKVDGHRSRRRGRLARRRRGGRRWTGLGTRDGLPPRTWLDQGQAQSRLISD